MLREIRPFLVRAVSLELVPEIGSGLLGRTKRVSPDLVLVSISDSGFVALFPDAEPDELDDMDLALRHSFLVPRLTSRWISGGSCVFALFLTRRGRNTVNGDKDV
jgi:hypothetical protein